MLADHENRNSKNILNKLNSFKYFLLDFKEYYFNYHEIPKEFQLEGNSKEVSTEISQTKTFIKLLIKTSESLKKIRTEKELEIRSNLKNLSSFNQSSFVNLKQYFNYANDVEVTKESTKDLLVKNISKKIFSRIKNDKALKPSKSSLILHNNIFASQSNDFKLRLNGQDASIKRNISVTSLKRLNTLKDKNNEVLTSDFLVKNLNKYNQRGMLSIDTTLKDIAKQLKLNKRDPNTNQYDNIIDGVKYTHNLRDNILLQRELFSKNNTLSKVNPNFRNSIFRETLNLSVRRLQEERLVLTNGINVKKDIIIPKYIKPLSKKPSSMNNISTILQPNYKISSDSFIIN